MIYKLDQFDGNLLYVFLGSYIYYDPPNNECLVFVFFFFQFSANSELTNNNIMIGVPE